jgi:hypothetical protein
VATKKTRAKSRRAKPAEVTVRFANEGRKMAKKSKPRKRNKSNPRKGPRRAARRNPSNPPRRRRRNPREDFADRAMKLGGGALLALGTGGLLIFGMGKLSATHPRLAEYGLPAAAFVSGAAVAKSHPILGGGIAIGALSPFALQVGSKLLTMSPATTPATTTTTAAGIARAIRAVQLGAVQRPLGAVQRAYA